MGYHFKQAKGYETYGEAVDMLRDIGLEGMSEAYMDAQAYGTPDQVLEKLVSWRKVIGPFDMIVAFRAAGIAYEDAENSMHLFASEVLPELRTWSNAEAA